MLHIHHAKYAVITFKNPTNIIKDNEEEIVCYTYDPQAKVVQWYSYNLAKHYESHLSEWVIFKANMCSLNNTKYEQVPPVIIANPQHLLSQRMFSCLEAFFDCTGYFEDNLANSSLFV